MALLMKKEEIEILLISIFRARFRTEASRVQVFAWHLENSLESDEDREYAVEFVLKNLGVWSPGSEVMRGEDISRQRFEKIAARIGPDLTFAFQEWTRQNISEPEIAKKIWNRIRELDSTVEKAVAFCLILLDRELVPYRQLPSASEELKILLSEMVSIEANSDIQNNHSHKAAIIRNLVLRAHKNRQNMGIIWKLVQEEPSEAERLMMFLRVWDAIEDKYTTAGATDWKRIADYIYA
jgi:hypothetical protein